ncbi:cell division protein FtsZ [Caviibacter abscessus]|uniref:cell division protein FtsZ n=1 Tax=Caviibacter abscessus TaxID=1766719 RepID=UPI00082AE42E|nr:cell division protein FtsZ [Caviibacter abscessus]
MDDNQQYNGYTNTEEPKAKIRIVGVGGAGGNIINNMIDSNITGVEYVAINTDYQDLNKSKAQYKISIGHLGAGGTPETARVLAEDKKSEIKNVLKDQDMIFVTAGMGGGTGTGAAPIIAQVAKELGILTVAIVTKPFTFEGKKRAQNTADGLENLKKYVDTLIVIPNQKLLELPTAKTSSYPDQLKLSNDILRFGVKGITELITKIGLINLDFSDVQAIMKDSGVALFGFAESQRDEETGQFEDIIKVAEKAIFNPLLEKDIKGATKILVNLTIGPNCSLADVDRVQSFIAQKASGTIDGVENVIAGVIFEPERESVVVSIIATGFDENKIYENSVNQTTETDVNIEEKKEEPMEYNVPIF